MISAIVSGYGVILWNKWIQSGVTLYFALICPKLFTLALRSALLALMVTACWVNSDVRPRSTSYKVSPSTSFVLPDLYRTSFPIKPSSRCSSEHKLGVSDLVVNDVWSVSIGSGARPGNVSGNWNSINSFGDASNNMSIRWKASDLASNPGSTLIAPLSWEFSGESEIAGRLRNHHCNYDEQSHATHQSLHRHQSAQLLSLYSFPTFYFLVLYLLQIFQ